MIIIENDCLKVHTIDPVKDRTYLGSRYCTGGYVWQIYNRLNQPLLRGPRFPEKKPSPFEGQGVPEAFETPLLNEGPLVKGEKSCVIGVGEVEITSDITPFHVRNNPHVTRFCAWEIHREKSMVSFTTRQTFLTYAFTLTKSISLLENTLRSSTSIENSGPHSLPVRWFAHPFFPLPPNNVCCSFDFPISMKENPAYFLNRDHYVQLKDSYNWSDGLFLPIDFECTNHFSATQNHPVCKNVRVNMNSPIHFLPIWANQNTFSFEPYIDQTLLSNENFSWHIEYHFGENTIL